MSGEFHSDQAYMGTDIYHHISRSYCTFEQRLDPGLVAADAVGKMKYGAKFLGAYYNPAT